mgnify:CR=1 FL=1
MFLHFFDHIGDANGEEDRDKQDPGDRARVCS